MSPPQPSSTLTHTTPYQPPGRGPKYTSFVKASHLLCGWGPVGERELIPQGESIYTPPSHSQAPRIAPNHA
eukprot:scaffold2014_cov112-Isochrysis_galbana.AAC.9